MYQPKTGERCTCKRGVQRDNCPECEGTGWKVDFKAIREQNKNKFGGVDLPFNEENRRKFVKFMWG